MRDESSRIVRLSTRDVAPPERLSYASWILGSALAPAAVSAETSSQYELDVTALELPSIAIVAQSGSPQRAIRARPEVRGTSQRMVASLRYLDTFAKTDGTWLFSERLLYVD